MSYTTDPKPPKKYIFPEDGRKGEGGGKKWCLVRVTTTTLASVAWRRGRSGNNTDGTPLTHSHGAAPSCVSRVDDMTLFSYFYTIVFLL